MMNQKNSKLSQMMYPYSDYWFQEIIIDTFQFLLRNPLVIFFSVSQHCILYILFGSALTWWMNFDDYLVILRSQCLHLKNLSFIIGFPGLSGISLPWERLLICGTDSRILSTSKSASILSSSSWVNSSQMS